MRNQFTYTLSETKTFIAKAKIWGAKEDYFLLLDSQGHKDNYSSFNCAIAAGNMSVFKPTSQDYFNDLFNFHKEQKDWIFGHLGYDLKNQAENLSSKKDNPTGFSEISFFVPEHLIFIFGNNVEIQISGDQSRADKIFNEITGLEIPKNIVLPEIKISNRISRKQYLETLAQLKEYIRTGEIYEVNFCQEFHAISPGLNLPYLSNKLSEFSPTPFSAYYKNNNSQLACASPERFLRKLGDKLISQPIKGTISREKDPIKDEAAKTLLRSNRKEQSENVMIVDLVRNDLSRVSKAGTITVDELMGIYSFSQVHQMISTVSAQISPDKTWVDALKSAFPMGSMTGAPKVRAMEIIDESESSRRSLFSGSVGYVSPSGDFDFNVIIRSIFYNQETGYLSFMAGGAITHDASAEGEYEESLLKTKAIRNILNI
jgi:para-aminobenzoate synthetase component 1